MNILCRLGWHKFTSSPSIICKDYSQYFLKCSRCGISPKVKKGHTSDILRKENKDGTYKIKLKKRKQ